MAFGATGDGVEQFLRRERLGQIIDGAGLDGFDRQLGRGVGGDHQERRVGPALAGRGQKLVAAHAAAQAGVGDDHEKLLLLQHGQRLLGRFHQAQVVAFAGQDRSQRQAHVLLVIDHQDGRKGPVHLDNLIKILAGNSNVNRVPFPSSDSHVARRRRTFPCYV